MKDKLLKIQMELKAPKNQRNTHGNYNYRSCEDILEAVKPLCLKYKCVLVISDSIINVGKFNYIETTASLIDIDTDVRIVSTAIAREAEIQKGMHEAQITGSTSSYARKYALNGLFAIDDTKDDDTKQPKGEDDKPKEKPKGNLIKALAAIKAAPSIADLEKICKFVEQNSWTDEESRELDFANSDKRSQLK